MCVTKFVCMINKMHDNLEVWYAFGKLLVIQTKPKMWVGFDRRGVRADIIVVESLSCVLLFFSPMDYSLPDCPWDFPGKNSGVRCYFLLQGIFPTQGSDPPLLHWQEGSLPMIHTQWSREALLALLRVV